LCIWEVNGTDSGSCPMEGFDFSNASRESVSYNIVSCLGFRDRNYVIVGSEFDHDLFGF
jgi:hypothetical protein